MAPPVELTTRPPAIGWQLPAFYCPITPAIHPDAARLEQRAIAWVDAFGLYENETDRAWGIATHSTDFSCRLIPDGDEEKLLLFILWNHWAFALDDTVHDTGSVSATTARVVDFNSRVARCLETPGAALLGPGPLTTALDDLVTRTRAATTPVELRLVADGLRDWLFGAAWQSGNTERGIMPGLADYVAMRPSINGTRFSLAWSMLARGIEVPPEELYSDGVQALTDVAGFVVSCDNDLFSYAKEDDQEALEQNLVNVLAHERGCSPQEALADAVAVRDRTMGLFLRLREQLAASAGPELLRYLEALGHYIVGCVQWMNTAPRYASPRNRHPLPVPGATWGITWRDTPTDPSTDPLPVPAAAWWWQQLDG
ncbi:hypothetical protein [Kitasatospora sp. MAP5-34]|uniref:terpene synthase family protein n=1 Tax=Kitasatospora sp. MAP5-34 TaxID=3035102 RepID=UPI002476BC07|nr:hypothetical protein [Kitasatospora sp. MAP5-34]MDH6578842.1 hypothetical protein [Kitasatospora sp. MAP5-34]